MVGSAKLPDRSPPSHQPGLGGGGVDRRRGSPGQPGDPPARPGRIRDRATFGELRRRGRRARAGVVTVTWLPGEPPARVAYAVGRAVGSAVERNRVRRRLRALVAESAAQLRPGAYLVGTASRAARSSYQGLRDDLRRALGQLQGDGE